MLRSRIGTSRRQRSVAVADAATPATHHASQTGNRLPGPYGSLAKLGREVCELRPPELLVKEPSIQAMSDGHGDRQRIGGLVAADFLVRVAANHGEIRLAVCDGRQL